MTKLDAIVQLSGQMASVQLQNILSFIMLCAFVFIKREVIHLHTWIEKQKAYCPNVNQQYSKYNLRLCEFIPVSWQGCIFWGWIWNLIAHFLYQGTHQP